MERRKKLDSKLTLNDHFRSCKDNLKKGDEILKFYDKNSIYKVIYDGNKFKLLSRKEIMNRQLNWDLVTNEISSYSSIESFWNKLVQNISWYKDYKPISYNLNTNKLITKLIIEFHNHFVENEFKIEDYKKLQKWVNCVYTDSIKRNEYKQYCANCKKLVFYNARYPKYICGDCIDKLTDRKGKQIEYCNTDGMGYGCQGYYKKTSQKEKYNSNIGYIGEKEFYAEEAHFGGIVVQLKE